MYLIIGLGNPGNKYVYTRHNIGFVVLARIAKKFNLEDAKSSGKNMLSIGRLFGKKVILAWPQTFMNLSGEAAIELVNYYKIHEDNILIVHDDMDLEPGRLKFAKGGNAAGHNGLLSLYKYLPNGFDRCKFGIGRPAKSAFSGGSANFVLAPFHDSEVNIIDKAADEAVDAIVVWLNDGLTKAQDIYNKRVK